MKKILLVLLLAVAAFFAGAWLVNNYRLSTHALQVHPQQQQPVVIVATSEPSVEYIETIKVVEVTAVPAPQPEQSAPPAPLPSLDEYRQILIELIRRNPNMGVVGDERWQQMNAPQEAQQQREPRADEITEEERRELLINSAKELHESGLRTGRESGE